MNHKQHHRTGCRSRACYRRVWIKEHPAPKYPPPTAADLCLGYHETTNNPAERNPPYSGEVEWEAGTWQAAEGVARVSFAGEAWEASRDEQAFVLNRYEPVAPVGTWPAWELADCF
jgi:hypothetical protein